MTGRRDGYQTLNGVTPMTFDKLNCGDTARDVVTGFSGTITGMAVYIAGCRQI